LRTHGCRVEPPLLIAGCRVDPPLVPKQSAFSKVTEHNDRVKIGRLFEQIDLGFGFEKTHHQKTIVTLFIFFIFSSFSSFHLLTLRSIVTL
jgi:hypothetical protein